MTPHAFRANTIAFLLMAVIISLVVYGCDTNASPPAEKPFEIGDTVISNHSPEIIRAVRTNDNWPVYYIDFWQKSYNGWYNPHDIGHYSAAWDMNSKQPQISLPEEWPEISHDSTHPTPLNAWIDSKGVLQEEFQ